MRVGCNLLNDDGEKMITVFIHGYCAIRSKEEFLNVASEINSLQLKGAVYLLYWRSGNWHIPPGLILAGKFLMKGKNVFSPPMIFLDLAGTVFMNFFKFKMMESAAEKLGRELPQRLSKIKNSRHYPITLVGHSLGARAIYYGLSEKDWSGFNITDVVFMGAAVSANPIEEFGESWENSISEINGKLFNLYSHKDFALGLKPMEDCAGKNPIRERVGRIININTGLGHTDYWPSLEWCFERVYPNRKRSKKYFGLIETYCPYCEESLLAISNSMNECPSCSVVFGYDHKNAEDFFTNKHPEPIGFECPNCEEVFPIQESAVYQCGECNCEIDIKRKGEIAECYQECDECDGDGYLEYEDEEDAFECENCEGEGRTYHAFRL